MIIAAPFDAPSPKRFTQGTQRIVSPAETLAKVQPFLETIGVTRVANVTGLDCIGLPVFMVCRPNSRSVSVHQGKGWSDDCARISGIMEGLEAWHAENLISADGLAGGHNEATYCSLNDLRASNYLALNGEKSSMCVNDSFSSDTKIPWLRSSDLLTGQDVFVPAELVTMDYRLPRPAGSGYFSSSTTGLGSGNSRVEATLHAMYEIVERDALTLWKYYPRKMRKQKLLKLESISDEHCAPLIRRVHESGFALGVWDITSDIGAPCFISRIIERKHDGGYVVDTGAGCHASSSVALSRAVTEAAQARLTRISGARDDMDMSYFERGLDGLLSVQYAYLKKDPGVLRFEDVADIDFPTLEEDMVWLIARLKACGITQILSVDLTQPRIDIPCVRVIIPGLEDGLNVPNYKPGNRTLRMARQWQTDAATI